MSNTQVLPQHDVSSEPIAQASWRDSGALLVYLAVLALISLHLYRNPTYDMDSIQYMGNALLMEDTDIVRVHQRVYAELRQQVPKRALNMLLGDDPKAPADQNQSRIERATNPYRFAEFLPMFAIRPSYNQALYLVGKTGVGLVRAGILISVAAYFLMGVLLFLWVRPYSTPWLAVSLCALCMASPPLMAVGRDPTSDALASLIAFLSLYLIFEKQQLAAGIAVLLSSIYFRTDFVVLAGPVLLICWLQRRLQFWQATVFGLLAVLSVVTINHFAGDYGIRMLYYRNFIGTPIAPGEVAAHFTARDYLSAFRSGVTKVADSFFVPFLLLGVTGLRSKKMLPIMAATLAYVMLHFVILPNWQERWVAVFYLSMVVSAATWMPNWRSDQSR